MNTRKPISFTLRRSLVPNTSLRRPETLRSISRIAKLMALAIRFEGLFGDGTVRDYAELARLGGVTRARITQIMKLRQLAPDLQEQILFLSDVKGLNERNLRPLVQHLDWCQQRRMFRKIMLLYGAPGPKRAGPAT